MISVYKEGDRFYLSAEDVKKLALVEAVQTFKARPRDDGREPMIEKPEPPAAKLKKVVWVRNSAGAVIGTKEL